jgi:hypothetical protein
MLASITSTAVRLTAFPELNQHAVPVALLCGFLPAPLNPLKAGILLNWPESYSRDDSIFRI